MKISPPNLLDPATGALNVGAIQVLRDTAANLASYVGYGDPPLPGQFVQATDTGKLAITDGVTTFANLPDIRWTRTLSKLAADIQLDNEPLFEQVAVAASVTLPAAGTYRLSFSSHWLDTDSNYPVSLTSSVGTPVVHRATTNTYKVLDATGTTPFVDAWGDFANVFIRDDLGSHWWGDLVITVAAATTITLQTPYGNVVLGYFYAGSFLLLEGPI